MCLSSQFVQRSVQFLISRKFFKQVFLPTSLKNDIVSITHIFNSNSLILFKNLVKCLKSNKNMLFSVTFTVSESLECGTDVLHNKCKECEQFKWSVISLMNSSSKPNLTHLWCVWLHTGCDESPGLFCEQRKKQKYRLWQTEPTNF